MKRFPVCLVILSLLIGLGFQGCKKDDDGGGVVGPTLTAPPNLTATTLSDQSIRLNWGDDEQYLAGYRVYRVVVVGNPVRIAELADNVFTFTDADLAEGLTYNYQVKGYTYNAESPAAEASATTMPKEPSDLQAHKLSGSEIEITWTDNSAVEEGYEVQRSLHSGSGFTSIDTLAADAVAFADAGLTQNTKYYYRVRALLGAVPSDWSMVANATTTVPWPNTPSNLVAQGLSDTEIQLNWQDRAINEKGFILEDSRAEEGPWSFCDSVTASASGNARHTAQFLTSGTMYYFRVYAWNDSGPSGYSNVASAETQPGPPLPPSGLGAEVESYRRVVLSWEDNSEDETAFRLQRKEHDSRDWVTLIETEADVVGHIDTTVAQRVVYDYRVCALNNIGPSSYSDLVTVTTPEGPPNAPVQLAGEPRSPTEIALSWRDMSLNELGFVVQMSLSVDNGWANHDTVNAGIRTDLISGLTAETRYFFRVFSYNANGASDPSNVIEVTTWPPPPEAPTGLTASAPTSAAVVLRWTDNADNEEVFQIEKHHVEDPNFTNAGSTGPDTVTFNDTEVQPTWSYEYRVRAHNQGGYSDYSNTVVVQVPDGPPLAPGAVMAQAQGIDRIQVTWQDRAATETGYELEGRVAGGNFANLAILGADEFRFTHEGLRAETTYEYRVRAVNEDGGFRSAWSPIASATTWDLIAFEDDFESYQVGQRPANRAYRFNILGVANVLVSNEDKHGGEKSLKFTDPDTAGVAQLIGTVENVITGSTDLWIKISRASAMQIVGGDENGTTTYRLVFQADGSTVFLNGTVYAAGPNYLAEQWIHVLIDFDNRTATYNVSFDGQRVISNASFFPAEREGCSVLVFTCFSDRKCPYLYVDDIVIRHADTGGAVAPVSLPRHNTFGSPKATDSRLSDLTK